MTYTFGEQLGALILVAFLSSVGGIILSILSSGYSIPAFGKWFKGYKIKPMLGGVRLSPVIGMICMGCLARNSFGQVMDSFPKDWAQWIRMCCLGMILVRGGLNVTFKGKGISVLLLSILPAFFEATTYALIGMGIFKMPIEVSYSMGFAAGSVATAIVATQMLRLNDLGYGREKGIASTLIAACTFDNIFNLVCFGICRTVTFQMAAASKGKAGSDASLSIGFLFV